MAWVMAFACLGLLLVYPRAAYAVPAQDLEALDDPALAACHSQSFDLLTPADIPSDGPIGVPTDSNGEPLLTVSEDGTAVDNYIPLVMIAIGYDGQPYDDVHDWYDRIYQGKWSVKQYYSDMSYGKFTFLPAQEKSAFGEGGNTNQADKVNDGVIHVTLDSQKTMGWVNDDAKAMIEELKALSDALTKASDYIDFASYDSNGDGTIQTSELAVGFVVAGKDAAAAGVTSQTASEYIWPHAYSYSLAADNYESVPDVPVVGGVAVDDFIAIAEYVKKGSALGEEGLGVITHELGHYLGLPDLYDADPMIFGKPWSYYSVDYVSLMDSGCYGRDLSGNEIMYSLDIWSRTVLGWVNPTTMTADGSGIVEIAGSLSSTDVPVAYRIDTPNEGEYYLIENRRFVSWDEGMGKFYPSAATSGGSEDRGGGLILWHIDDNIVDKHSEDGNPNYGKHHPGVMPLYLEEDWDTDDVWVMGDSPITEEPFFDASEMNGTLPLPIYGTVENDRPEDRTLTTDLLLSLDAKTAPVMRMHLHYMNPTADWNDDHTSADLLGMCYIDWKVCVVETTTDITSEVTEKPSSTESGVRVYTAHFKIDNREETTFEMIPPLDAETVAARDVALAELVDIINNANTTLAQGAYTPESFNALKDAIAAANALFEDDTAVAEDVKAAQAEVLRNLRLLVPMNPADVDNDAAWREAVYDLAELLTKIYGGTDPEAYKPAAYEAFMEVVDQAYEVLANESATTKELADAKTKVVRAQTLLEKSGKRIKIDAAVVSGLSDVTYNGKAFTPEPVVTLKGATLVAGTDYTVSYAGNTNAGTATVKVTGAGDYTGEATGSFAIAKAANPLAVKGKTASVKLANLNKKTQRLDVSKVITFTKKGVGTMSYKKASGSTKIVVNKKTGQIQVKKGLKKGTYKVKIKVQAAGNANYLS